MSFNDLDAKATATAAFAAVGTFAVLSAAWVVYDYNQWVAFGTGGTPPTPSGYVSLPLPLRASYISQRAEYSQSNVRSLLTLLQWRMTKFRWRMFRSSDDLRDASKIEASGPTYLRNLPLRAGQRPRIVARTMPQRQQPEKIDPAVRERVHNLPKKYCDQHPQFLTLDLSKTEGRSTDAIYANPDLPGRDPAAKDRMLGNEVAHVHPAENSLHVWLSPSDAKQAVEKGWGERFPLSSLGMLHPSFIMIYAPRSMDEVDVIEEIVQAGIGYLTGEKV